MLQHARELLQNLLANGIPPGQSAINIDGRRQLGNASSFEMRLLGMQQDFLPPRALISAFEVIP